MTNLQAVDQLHGILNRWHAGIHRGGLSLDIEAIRKAITALEHQPEPDGPSSQRICLFCEQPITGEDCPCRVRPKNQMEWLADGMPTPSALECNVCHWRTLDTTRTLCDSCGSFELAAVSDIGRKAGA